MDCGTSLHTRSKGELTSDQKDTIRRSKEPTVITSANRKPASTEEATVHGNDLDVFVTMILLEDSPAVSFLGLFFEETGYSNERKKGEPPSLIKDGEVTRCKPQIHVPIVAISKNFAHPMTIEGAGRPIANSRRQSIRRPVRTFFHPMSQLERNQAKHRVTDCMFQVSKHRDSGRTRFFHRFNFSKKAFLANLQTHL